MRTTAKLLSVVFLVFSAGRALACEHSVKDGVLTVEVKDAKASLNEAWSCGADLVARNAQLSGYVFSISQGKYYLTEPLTIPADWSRRKLRVGIKGASAVITGAQALKDWRRVAGGGSAGKSAANATLYEVSVPRALGEALKSGWQRDHGGLPRQLPPELLIDGELFKAATWPEDGYAAVKSVDEQGRRLTMNAPAFPGASGEVLMQGFLAHDWADGARNVTVSRGAGANDWVLQFESWPKYGAKAGGRFVLSGASEFIAAPGQYYFSPERGAITFWAKSAPSTVELTAVETLLKGDKLENLTIEGVAFDGARGVAVDLRGRGIRITNTEVRNVGVTGLRLEGSDAIIKASKFRNSGGIAVDLKGGDREKLTPGQLQFKNNVVENFGRLIWSSVPGIRVNGVGNVIANNDVSQGPHAGIFYFGNDHEIAGNNVHAVALRTGDVGAIYTGRDWAGRGHKVHHNYIHDVQGVGQLGATALYIDDQSSGVEIRDNVVRNVRRGVLVGGGRDNVITRNAFFDVRTCIKVDARGLNWQQASVKAGGELWKRLDSVPYKSSVWKQRYPRMERLAEDRPGVPVGNAIYENASNGCEWDIAPEASESGEVRANQDSASLKLQAGASAASTPSVDWSGVFDRTR